MRVRGAVLGVVGFGLSAGAALGQGSAAPRRGAVLLPPVPGDPPVVARAAAEELPPFPGSTPVNRNPARSFDPSVRPAGGATAEPPPAPRPEPNALAKGIDKLKGAFASERPDRGVPPPAPSADAHSPFRGTSPTGAPVYAGPPAYRWYGWGSVTPGGNPFAPAGQYPQASAHWHSITGATPGAFPVPVADPTRPPPGPEPPAYAAAPARRTPPAAPPPPVPARVQGITPTPPADPQYLPPTPEPRRAAPVAGPPAVPVPVLTAPPTPAVPDRAESRVVAGPFTLAPLVPRPADPVAPAAPLPPLPVLPPVTVPAGGETVEPPKPAGPDEPARWQPNPTAPAAPAGGDWAPAGPKPGPR